MDNPRFWEQKDKNPIVAALLTTSLIMAAYGFIGSLVANILVLVDLLAEKVSGIGDSFSGGYFQMLTHTYERYRWMILAVTVASQFLVFLGLTAFVFKKWHGLPLKEYFRIRKTNISSVLLALGGIAFILPVAISLGELSGRAFPILKELEGPGNALLKADTPLSWVLILGAIGITPAICEEFLFRGYLHRTLSRRIAQPLAYVISGGFFALIHQNYFGLATLILVGVYLGFVFSRFDSIWPGAAVHCAYNSLLVLIVNKEEYFTWLFNDDGFVRLPFVAAGLAGSALMASLILARTKLSALATDTAIQAA